MSARIILSVCILTLTALASPAVFGQAMLEDDGTQEVSLQLSPEGGLEVETSVYYARVGADGNLHSLRVGETELLDDEASSLGAFFFSDEAKRLGRVTVPAPAVVLATDGEYKIRYRFLPGEVRLWLSHAAAENAAFYMVLSDEISLVTNARTGQAAAVPAEERWTDVTFTAISGAFMTVRGGDRVWGPWAQRQALEIGPIAAQTTRELTVSFGRGEPPKPTPSQLLSIEAETVDNLKVLGLGEEAQLLVTVENRGEKLSDALLTVVIEGRENETLSEVAQQMNIGAKSRAQGRFDIALPGPGLYNANLSLSSANRVLQRTSLKLAYRTEEIKPPLSTPPDFESFWAAALEQADDPNLEPAVFEEDATLSSPQVKVWRVSFTGAGGKPLLGWLCVPGGAEASPAILQLLGYGRPKVPPPLVLAGRGYAALALEIVEEGIDNAYIARGLEDPRDYALRNIVINALRGMNLLAGRAEVDPQRIAVMGASQGGGIALMIAALRPETAAVSADVMMLSDFPRSIKEGDWPYSEIARYLQKNPQAKSDVLRTLRYYDVVNFAPRVQCPVLLSVGLKDNMCRPETIFAAYNHLGGPKEIKVYPEAGHEGGGSAHWIYKLRWLDSLLEPSPNLPFARTDKKEALCDYASAAR